MYTLYFHSCIYVCAYMCVTVYGLVDRQQFNEGPSVRAPGAMQRLIDCGISVRLIKPTRHRYSSMHQKIWIVDQRFVILGSANGSHHSLTNNAEVVVLLDSTAHALYFENSFMCYDLDRDRYECDRVSNTDIARAQLSRRHVRRAQSEPY